MALAHRAAPRPRGLMDSVLSAEGSQIYRQSAFNKKQVACREQQSYWGCESFWNCKCTEKCCLPDGRLALCSNLRICWRWIEVFKKLPLKKKKKCLRLFVCQTSERFELSWGLQAAFWSQRLLPASHRYQVSNVRGRGQAWTKPLRGERRGSLKPMICVIWHL